MTLDLETIELIRTEKARYCRLLDTKQFDALADLLAPDAVFVFRGLEGEIIFRFQSPAEFLADARARFATTRTIHQTHNAEITLESVTEASAIWSMEDWHMPATDDGDPADTMHGYGFYHERWRLLDGRWKLARFELRRALLFTGAA